MAFTTSTGEFWNSLLKNPSLPEWKDIRHHLPLLFSLLKREFIPQLAETTNTSIPPLPSTSIRDRSRPYDVHEKSSHLVLVNHYISICDKVKKNIVLDWKNHEKIKVVNRELPRLRTLLHSIKGVITYESSPDKASEVNTAENQDAPTPENTTESRCSTPNESQLMWENDGRESSSLSSSDSSFVTASDQSTDVSYLSAESDYDFSRCSMPNDSQLMWKDEREGLNSPTLSVSTAWEEPTRDDSSKSADSDYDFSRCSTPNDSQLMWDEEEDEDAQFNDSTPTEEEWIRVDHEPAISQQIKDQESTDVHNEASDKEQLSSVSVISSINSLPSSFTSNSSFPSLSSSLSSNSNILPVSNWKLDLGWNPIGRWDETKEEGEEKKKRSVEKDSSPPFEPFCEKCLGSGFPPSSTVININFLLQQDPCHIRKPKSISEFFTTPERMESDGEEEEEKKKKEEKEKERTDQVDKIIGTMKQNISELLTKFMASDK